MNPTTETPTDDGALKLSGALDIYGADVLRETLRTRLGALGEIVIDLSQIESCDTTGIQLLLSARRQATETGRILHFRHASVAVQSCSQRLGLPRDL